MNNNDNGNVQIPEKMVFMPTWISLPSQWDESVSQVEMLQGILYNVNCIIQYLEDLQTNYEEYTNNAINNLRDELTTKYDQAIADLKQYHDNAVTALYEYIDTQDTNYWIKTLAEVQRLDSRIDDLTNYVNVNFSDIRSHHQQDVDNIYQFIDSTRQELMVFIELNNQSIMKWVEDKYQEIMDQVDEINEDGFRILNPTTGLKEKVEKTVNDVYNALRVFGVTVQEYDEWFTKYGHTGTDFKFLNMSALEFDTRSWLEMYGFGYDDIISPVTGQKTSIQIGLEQVSTNGVIISSQTGNLTCEQWDNLGFDQNDFEVNYPISAYQHDFSAVHMFDNRQIATVDYTTDYVREYSLQLLPNDSGKFIVPLDGDTFTLQDIFGLQVTKLQPDTITNVSDIKYFYSMTGNTVNSIEINLTVLPETNVVSEMYIRLRILDKQLIPSNISNSNPPKPIPLGNVTASQYDAYFDGHDGNDFKLLNMSAYEYDTNSISFMGTQ